MAQAFDILSLDLKDVTNISEYNSGYKWLLFAIDLGSRYLQVRPLRAKTADEVVRALRDIFASMERDGRPMPRSAWADQGKEFLAKKVQNLFKQHAIHFYSTRDGKIKSSAVERVIQTVMQMLYRYFTLNDTLEYLPVLQDMVKTYNATYHSSIGMAPAAVTHGNAHDVWIKSHYKNYTGAKPPQFKKGDHVFLTKDKTLFAKGYTRRLRLEVFKVIRVIRSNPVTYVIEDMAQQRVEGAFYGPEMVKTQKPEHFDIESILQTRTKTVRGRKTKQHLVKWLHYPATMNSWVDDADVVSKK